MAAVTQTASDHATAQSKGVLVRDNLIKRGGPATHVKQAPEDHPLSFPISFSLEQSSQANYPQHHSIKLQIIGSLEEESALCKTVKNG